MAGPKWRQKTSRQVCRSAYLHVDRFSSAWSHLSCLSTRSTAQLTSFTNLLLPNNLINFGNKYRKKCWRLTKNSFSQHNSRNYSKIFFSRKSQLLLTSVAKNGQKDRPILRMNSFFCWNKTKKSNLTRLQHVGKKKYLTKKTVLICLFREESFNGVPALIRIAEVIPIRGTICQWLSRKYHQRRRIASRNLQHQNIGITRIRSGLSSRFLEVIKWKAISFSGLAIRPEKPQSGQSK